MLPKGYTILQWQKRKKEGWKQIKKDIEIEKRKREIERMKEKNEEKNEKTIESKRGKEKKEKERMPGVISVKFTRSCSLS